MGIRWTERQQQVIDTRGKNLLVSAAAGSGKTAVLVERIIQMVTDKEKPMDIDKLLVVTFTRAAAAEMKERVIAALEKELESEPENEHLQRQSLLVHNASITTIDSFCQSVVRENFNATSLDPAFRVGDERELKLLKADVMKAVLEENYSGERSDFFDFVEDYVEGKNDQKIEDIIIKLYEFSQSHPWPEDWLSECGKAYNKEENEVFSGEWYEYFKEYISITLNECINMMKSAIEICNEPGGPEPYIESFENDLNNYNIILNACDYVEMSEKLQEITTIRLKAAKKNVYEEELINRAKALRDSASAKLKTIKEKYFFQNQELMKKDILESAGSTKVLLDITREFMERYKAEKIERNIVDFSDLEHYALEVLVKKDENNITVPTDIAKEMSDRFDEIMIDEYQDSNLVQETILNSISKEYKGNPNIFMVGDVKQSIYKFRMARPELFVEKYNTYSKDMDADYQLIVLDKNFRSRDTVIDFVNYVFRQIMRKSLGDIEYDKDNELSLGADYKNEPEMQDFNTELILLESEKDTMKEIETNYIASKIEELIESEYKVTDKESGEYRPVEYRDIAILYRGLNSWISEIEDALITKGIPYVSDSGKNLFDTLEIKTLINILKVVDNPRQDIPIAAVLKSPVVGLNDNEMAEIRAVDVKSPFYINVLEQTELIKNESIKTKIEVLKEKLEKYREMAIHYHVSDLIHFITEDTEYYLYVSAMPFGSRRSKNLDLFEELAESFESNGNKGLFGFIKYLDKMIKNQMEIPEARISSDNENAVKIMSIHKSKGLEFPVVFVAALGTGFNKMDLREKIILHPEMGIGVNYMDSEKRITAKTLIKNVIATRTETESMGEELRVLYVAMTRAKEKLFLVGSDKEMQTKIEKWSIGDVMPADAKSMLDWVGASLIRHPAMKDIKDQFGIASESYNNIKADTPNVEIHYIDDLKVVENSVESNINKVAMKNELLKSEPLPDEEVTRMFSKISFEYKYKADEDLRTKMSVSEIKKMSQHEDDEMEHSIFINDEIVNEQSSEKGKVAGTERGSAYHRVFELLTLNEINDKKDVEKDIISMTECGKLSKEWADLVNIDKVYTFIMSDIGVRMRNALEKKKLYREQQYVMGIPANEVDKKYSSDELVLIQGIIDAFFEENGKIIIVDYKTDRVDNEQQLVDRYKVQLDYYEKAVSRIMGTEVGAKVIYSVHLGRSIEI